MSPIKVLVVDDSFFMRKVLVDILAKDPAIDVVGQASDGEEALQRINELHPDVVTLDLIMPKLNGVGTLERIVGHDQAPAVIMVSAHTLENAEITLDCLAMGAVDFVLKPSESIAPALTKISAELCSKIKMAARVKRDPYSGTLVGPAPAKASGYAAVVIGSSTGGPVALEQLLPALPKDTPYPVFVAQHLPAQFVYSLTTRLAKHCELSVEIAQSGSKIRSGTIYFAPGGAETEVVRDGGGHNAFLVVPSDNILTPSVNKLMVSVAHIYQAATLGVILTGMGEDGLEGMKAIKAAGGHTIVQDEQSSIVFGMARAVVEGQLADEVVPLDHIAEKIR